MSIAIPKFYPKMAVSKGCWQSYLALGLLTNVAVWLSAVLYLKLTPPTYTSYSAIAVPGEGGVTNVNLPNIGQASYERSSPYAITTQDPREGYKFIAESEPVLKAAASQLDETPASFGKPRIKVVDNSPIIEVEFKGRSPQEAQQKALAFYSAFETRLNTLRSQELIRRDSASQSALLSSEKKLEVAQNRLSKYKAISGLDSSEQLRDLSVNIEQLRKQRVETLAQQQQISTRQQQLSSELNLSPQQAVDAFVLQTDQIFQQNLKDYSEASATLDILNSKFLQNTPPVVEQKAKRDAAQTALIKRSQSLLGRPVSQVDLQRLNLSNVMSDSARERLFQELVTAKAEQKALYSQAQTLDEQIAQLEDRFKRLTQQEVTLNGLKRDMQVAEAVFSSTLTKLDMSKSNSFGSYPLIQFIIEPTLPEGNTWPSKIFVVIGTAISCLLLNAGIILLWLNQANNTTKETNTLIDS